MKKELVVVFWSLVTYAASARILALLPFAAKSHHIFFQEVLKTLALKGHDIVVYSSFPQEQAMSNYVDIYVNTSYSENFVTYELIFKLLRASRVANMKSVWEKMDRFTEDAFQNENIQKLIASKESFDLIITEPFFGLEALLGFGYKFNAPTIGLHPLGCYGFVNRALGNSLALSYVPDSSLSFDDHMTLYERIVNFYSIISSLVSFYLQHIPKQQEILDRYMKLENSPSLGDLVGSVSLVFTNSHPTIHYAQPLSPNIIPLGGIHVSTKRKQLPQDILKFMEEATHGVIYFSLGTVVPDHLMPELYFKHFLRVFKTLPQRILWKTRTTNLVDVPPNVMVVKWAPQQDVLAHHKCVLFITHGGLLSLLETVYAGVPVVGIPFFNDQPMNVHYYESKGVGVKLDFLSLSEDKIFNAIQTVLQNPQYKENALRLSAIFKDVPLSQSASAVFWTEYVLTHKGAHHLRPTSASLSWYQLALLDILAFILMVLAVAILTSLIIWRIIKSRIFRNINRRCFPKKKNSNKKQSN